MKFYFKHYPLKSLILDNNTDFNVVLSSKVKYYFKIFTIRRLKHLIVV